ncbi:MAG: AAA family ATPase [Deltaproteobacteria bacterium]|nr:AAA family ATPase [Deltaproteobacteria bacterium]
MSDFKKFEVPPDQLRWHCDPAVFNFSSTKELDPLREFIGQDRAIRAIEFGLSMEHDGYNVFVAGLTGTGKTSMVKSYIERIIAERQASNNSHPQDWAYVYNFTDADCPRAISMPQGTCKDFRSKVLKLLDRLKEDLTRAFSSEEYKAERKKVVEENEGRQQQILRDIAEDAQKEGFIFQMTQMGPVVMPMQDGQPMDQTQYMALDEQLKKDLDKRHAEFLKRVQSDLEKMHELRHESVRKINEADKHLADTTITRLYSTLITEYQDQEKIVSYLDGLKKYTLDNLEIFKVQEDQVQTAMGMPTVQLTQNRDPYLPFQVNVFIDNSDTKGPPVVTEANPIYPNLFGKIERRFLLGGYLSDHTMLKPGAVHRANGGYLLLSAVEIVTNMGVWPALKRAIRTREVRVEDPYEQFGLFAPQGMRPEAIPIETKIFLIGDPYIYQTLSMYDEEFWELFRVKADFDYQVQRTPENINAFAAFIAGCCEDCELRHYDTSGVARTLEFASRMVSDQQKLSSRFAQIRELVKEADYWARQDNADLVSARHVEKAIDERLYRHNLPDERIKEMMERGTVMIDTDGAVVGQVNGLSVYSLGDATFGKPSRITCRTFMGRQGIINIEREVELSGPIHNKGVLILNGYLGSRFAQDQPLSLSASLCFEQSYEGVDGDSASSTELYALLSSLSGVPIKQGIAVTGSVNQKGDLQPIGGVNQKIEGFYQICQAKGLTGEQGVMIPGRNVDNLMLRRDVVAAVEEGKFHIWAVDIIDEGIEILTGLPMGRAEDGKFPEDTIGGKVDRTLRDMANKLKSFGSPVKDNPS